MEKAILKTLVYADIFDYPLKVYEIHKWLIGQKVTLRQIEKALKKLNYELRPACRQAGIMNYKGYYFLPGRKNLVSKRIQRAKFASGYLRQAKLVGFIFKLIPFVKLVGISGSLAMENCQKEDDIDLFVITGKGRLWLSRILMLGILELLGKRRKKEDKNKDVAGKICLNLILEEDNLTQEKRNVYLAHEILQMKVLWQRGGVYQKYLLDNDWVFKFLPNWISTYSARGPAGPALPAGRSISRRASSLDAAASRREALLAVTPSLTLFDWLESLARKFQLWYMKQPQGMERVKDGALYFHPEDLCPKVLNLYKQKLAMLDNNC